MLTFNRYYFGSAILLFGIEVLIALFVRDRFVRPYFGDVLVVMLLYCFVKAFLNVPPITLALCVLVFAFTIEFLQYVNIVQVLGLQHSKLACTVLGTSFAWYDLVAYVAGALLTVIAEKYIVKKLAWNIS